MHKQEKCTSDKRVEIVKKYIWAALEAPNHHNQCPQITQGTPWGVLETHHTTRRLKTAPCA